MTNNNLEKLHKNRGSVTENESKVDETRNAMKKICTSLDKSSKEYQPEDTVQIIIEYIRKEKRLDRMLYSEISYYIFNLDKDSRGIIVANMAQLLEYSLTVECFEGIDSTISEDCRKVIVKLYDHFELASYQIGNANKIFEKSIEEIKSSFSKEIKKIERDYITILGIFTSIVLVFIGEFSFSSAVLTNISDVSIYRLLLIIDALALIMINIVAFLVKMILKVNNVKSENLRVTWLNVCLGIFAIILVIGWVLDIGAISEFVRPRMPWK